MTMLMAEADGDDSVLVAQSSARLDRTPRPKFLQTARSGRPSGRSGEGGLATRRKATGHYYRSVGQDGSGGPHTFSTRSSFGSFESARFKTGQEELSEAHGSIYLTKKAEYDVRIPTSAEEACVQVQRWGAYFIHINQLEMRLSDKSTLFFDARP